MDNRLTAQAREQRALKRRFTVQRRSRPGRRRRREGRI